MVKGLEIFKRYFSDFKEQYVLIGGAACDIIFTKNDSSFRMTKDLDIVLVVEALTKEFGEKFWEFIRAGGYEHRARSNGSPQFYRFDKPKSPDFPYMLELFSQSGSIEEPPNGNACVPLHLDDEVSSLSAILLNQDYYNLLLGGRVNIDDMMVLSPLSLIPFKAKAWLDLSERKLQGMNVDSRDVKKHKNDVLRLAPLLTGEERYLLHGQVYDDMQEFIRRMQKEAIDIGVFGIPDFDKEDMMLLLKTVYVKEI